ncbi:MAG: MFS transporter [Alphaproteobacteria bacterium]|nr:MFS transporter [Alphaproteobacteria bacterium]
MRSVLLATWALFFGFAFTLQSTGLQGPLPAVRAFGEGFDTSNTGLIMAGFFAGYLVGALMAPRMIRNVGHTKVFAAVASIASGTALLHAVFVDPVVWFALRLATGFCLAGIFIVTETWLNLRSPNEVRGKIMNLYLMVTYLGWGTGALLLNLSSPLGYDLFILASVLISFGIVPILLSTQPTPSFEAPKPLGVLALYRRFPLGVGAIFMAGLAVGALIGAGPIFAHQSGFITAHVSLFMAAIFLGSLIFMWPIGILSDRYDRSRVMIAVASLAAFAALLLAATPVDIEILIFLLTALFAGPCFSIYGICLAITNDHLEPDEMVGGGTTLFICFSVGMILGPVISTEIIEAWQPSAYFLFLATVQVLIVAYAIAVIARPGGAPAPERRPLGSWAHRHGHWITPRAMKWSSEPERRDT